MTRLVLWTARTLDDPKDPDGPLLRTLCARVMGVVCTLVPGPVWTLGTWLAWAAGVPVRGVLWMWGIGRGRVEIRKRACYVVCAPRA